MVGFYKAISKTKGGRKVTEVRGTRVSLVTLGHCSLILLGLSKVRCFSPLQGVTWLVGGDRLANPVGLSHK